MPWSVVFPSAAVYVNISTFFRPSSLNLRQIGLRELADDLAVRVEQARHRRLIVRLGDVDEVLSVGRQRDRVRERRIGQALVVLAVEADAVQLQLHVVVAVARHVVASRSRLVDARRSRRLRTCSCVSGVISFAALKS